jgi:hypothetical protein
VFCALESMSRAEKLALRDACLDFVTIIERNIQQQD